MARLWKGWVRSPSRTPERSSAAAGVARQNTSTARPITRLWFISPLRVEALGEVAERRGDVHGIGVGALEPADAGRQRLDLSTNARADLGERGESSTHLAPIDHRDEQRLAGEGLGRERDDVLAEASVGSAPAVDLLRPGVGRLLRAELPDRAALPPRLDGDQLVHAAERRRVARGGEGGAPPVGVDPRTRRGKRPAALLGPVASGA